MRGILLLIALILTMKNNQIIQDDCLNWLQNQSEKKINLSFLDPPFNQGKDYRYFNDNLSEETYWNWLKEILNHINRITHEGGAIYLMHREKNCAMVLNCLAETGWTFQNLIIWKKKTSAIPSTVRYGKQYQIIVYATKGKKPRIFNRLRINPPLPIEYKYERENGIYLTDIWDDIRELTSGYFAGDEALRNDSGERFHKQQAPIALLLRIILASSVVNDTIFDPFSGTGTTLITADQLARKFIGIEIDPDNINCIKNRLEVKRESDQINKFYPDYIYTENIDQIWGLSNQIIANFNQNNNQIKQLSIF